MTQLVAQDGLNSPIPDAPEPAAELFATELFAGFGPSSFRATGEIPLGRLVRGPADARLKAGVRDYAPRHPGCYGMLDKKGRVIYVGKAKSLRSRLLSYFRENSRDPKAGKIVRHTHTLVWEECPDELGALLRELELIRRYRPKFNVLGMPGPRRYVYLTLAKGGSAPLIALTREPTGKEIAAYGPFVGRRRVADAVRKLNDTFRLRDCSAAAAMSFTDQPELFPLDRAPKCLRYELGTCPGPCAGLSSRKEYGQGVRAARTFLDGKDSAPVNRLLKEMRIASAELRFEQAGALRDKLLALEWVRDRLQFLRAARQGGAYVYPHTGPDGRTVWYLLHHGTIRAAVREPTSEEGKDRAARLMTQVFAESAGSVTFATVDSVLLVAAWFRKHPDEKAKLIGRAAAYAKLGLPVPELPPEADSGAPAVRADLPDDFDPLAFRKAPR